MSADRPGLPRHSTTKSEPVFEVPLDQDFLPVVTSFLSSPQVDPASHSVLHCLLMTEALTQLSLLWKWANLND